MANITSLIDGRFTSYVKNGDYVTEETLLGILQHLVVKLQLKPAAKGYVTFVNPDLFVEENAILYTISDENPVLNTLA